MQKHIIKAALFTPISHGRWGLPLLLWAGPGVAKTSVFEDVAAQFSLPCETLSPSERGEGAFGVVPVPDRGKDGKEDMLLTYPAPEWTKRFLKAGRGVIFVDEITSSPPALMPPLMGLFLARRIGGCVLPKGVRCMAAANPPELAASGYDLPMPLANRMGHIDWEGPSVEEHAQFMLRGASGNAGMNRLVREMDEDAGIDTAEDEEIDLAFDAQAEEDRVMKAWPEAWARAVGLETSYLQSKTDEKNGQPKVGDPKGGRAWPSDRTWEMATRAYAAALVHRLSAAETEEFVQSFIGHGAASLWFAFMHAQDLPNSAQLLDGKITFKHDSTRLDRTVAVLQSCTALVAPKAAVKRAERSAALWEIIAQLTTDESHLDLLVPTAQALIELDLHSMKQCAKVLAKLNPILKAAKIQQGAR